jgi:catechol 2,3-dioxygenase
VERAYPRAPHSGTPSRGCGTPDGRCAEVTDHGTHLAVHISDPDGNVLELAWDRPFDEWSRDEAGHAAMAMDDEIDLDALIAEAQSG